MHDGASMSSKRHPFAGAAGTKLRDTLARRHYVAQHGRCAICLQAVDPSMRGYGERDSAVVDHVRPWRLDPAGAKTGYNTWLVCAHCHNGVIAEIERRYWPVADAIERAKRDAARGRYVPLNAGFTPDGRPIWPEPIVQVRGETGK